MIASVSGVLAQRDTSLIVITTDGGVGYELHVPLGVFERLPATGARVTLFTELVVREDSWALYGFYRAVDRVIFQRLLGASGFGPRLALALISALSAERTVRAIRSKELAILSTVPGIGKKKAERLVLELHDKFGDIELGSSSLEPLSEADESVRAFSHAVLPQGMRGPSDALALAEAIRDRVAYETGVTAVSSTASQALALGRGVCQDHAHLFLAASRELGVPARYVSGYLHPGDSSHAASHAWAEVRLPDAAPTAADGRDASHGMAGGWLGYDISNQCLADGRYVKLAIGADYLDACPVRGVRTGGGLETMRAEVLVKPGTADQQ